MATDLDGTLIPTEGAPRDTGIAEFSEAVGGRPNLTLAYVTGRRLATTLNGMARFELPLPHALACNVGTEVYIRSNGGFVPDPAYRALMREALGGIDPEEVRNALEGVPGLRLQEPEDQSEFKMSYDVPGGAEGEDVEDVLERVRARLAADVGDLTLVTSVDPRTGWRLLDVLPAGVAKDTAVRYLHERSHLPRDAVLYAGDSGNDRAALLGGFNAVVVGNAPEELKGDLRRQARQAGIAPRVYFATASFARGVVEGGRHFGVW